MTRPAAPDPDGWQARPDPDWRLITTGAKACRFGAGPTHPACGAAAVAELRRDRAGRPVWWAYCPAHLYGRWIEHGAVHQWVRVEP